MDVFRVGGFVRDFLMGIEPKDKDFLIMSTAENLIQEGFSLVGKDFNVFLHPITKEEYALPRGQSLEEDLWKRDLTINSMAMNSDHQIIDPFGGQKDISNRILRHTSIHFADDPIRILRLARFHTRYGFSIAHETKNLVSDMVKNKCLQNISKERIFLEFQKAFHEKNIKPFISFLFEIKLLQSLPGFSEFNDLNQMIKMISDNEQNSKDLFS